MHPSLAKSAKGATPLHAVKAANLKNWLAGRGKREAEWLRATHFAAKDGEISLVPNAQGGVACLVLGLGKGEDPLAFAAMSESLSAGIYSLGDVPKEMSGANAAL